MTEEKKKNLIKRAVWALLISAAFLLQSTDGISPKIGNIPVTAVLPVLSVICMFEKEKTACWYGLFAGLLMDVVSPSMVGYNALILLILSTGIGFLSTNYLRNTLLTNLLVGFAFVFLNRSLYWLFFIEFKQLANAGGTYLTVYLPSIFIDWILIIPTFFIIRAINLKLKPKLNGD